MFFVNLYAENLVTILDDIENHSVPTQFIEKDKLFQFIYKYNFDNNSTNDQLVINRHRYGNHDCSIEFNQNNTLQYKYIYTKKCTLSALRVFNQNTYIFLGDTYVSEDSKRSEDNLDVLMFDRKKQKWYEYGKASMDSSNPLNDFPDKSYTIYEKPLEVKMVQTNSNKRQIFPDKQPLYKTPQEQTKIFPKTIISDSFKKAYDDLKKTPNSLKAQEQYFIHFPSNFKIFSYLLGYYEKVHGEYSDNDLNGIYYEAVFENMNSGLDMVHIFFKLDKIHQDRVYNKIIDIYQNAYWQSDGFGIFMSAVKDMLERSDIRLEEFIEVLSKRSANEQKEFWRVYFDTPVPMRKLTPSLKKIETLNPNMYKIMYESVK